MPMQRRHAPWPVSNITTALGLESERENRRGILRLAYVAVTIGGVYCRDRVRAGIQWKMSAKHSPRCLYKR